jgi:hypothetical protein
VNTTPLFLSEEWVRLFESHANLFLPKKKARKELRMADTVFYDEFKDSIKCGGTSRLGLYK